MCFASYPCGKFAETPDLNLGDNKGGVAPALPLISGGCIPQACRLGAARVYGNPAFRYKYDMNLE